MTGKKIAFFDFDGTITTKDTLLEIIKFQKGTPSFYFGFLLHAPWLVGYKLKLFPNDRAKEKILRYFFSGLDEKEFQRKCDLFADEKLPALIRPGALKEIERLKGLGFEIVIISASAGNWIRQWAAQLGVALIATKLEVVQGRITGRIEGKNCHGEQKVSCIRAGWDLSAYDEVFAFGDSSGDRPMMALATQSFYQPFRTA